MKIFTFELDDNAQSIGLSGLDNTNEIILSSWSGQWMS